MLFDLYWFIHCPGILCSWAVSNKVEAKRVRLLSTLVYDSVINMKKSTTAVPWIQTIKVQVPWYTGKNAKDFRVLRNADGVPLDVVDPKRHEFWNGLRTLCESTGVIFVAPQSTYGPHAYCLRCDEIFERKRRTARFCEECRLSHDRRKEQDPLYEKQNRIRAREGMDKLRHPEKYGNYKSQNRKGRTKRKKEKSSVTADDIAVDFF
jgi:hypothetical protein